MSYHNTSATDVRARKRHLCTWCGEKIKAGEIYKKWTCIGDDGPSTVKMHQECKVAMDRHAQVEPGEFEYDPHSFTRGCICESGDSGHGTYPHCTALPLLPSATDDRTPSGVPDHHIVGRI